MLRSSAKCTSALPESVSSSFPSLTSKRVAAARVWNRHKSTGLEQAQSTGLTQAQSMGL